MLAFFRRAGDFPDRVFDAVVRVEALLETIDAVEDEGSDERGGRESRLLQALGQRDLGLRQSVDPVVTGAV